MQTRNLTEEERAVLLKDWPPRELRPAPDVPAGLIRRTTIFVALFCGALLGLLIGLNPMGLYVAEALK